jgi:hypothetical protein
MNIDDLNKIKVLFEKQPIKERSKYLMFSINTWKCIRKSGVSLPRWSNYELENHDPYSGLIGKKDGIECYVSIIK